ncbi:MAG: ATP synthase F0 subunit B [Deltaproteobacteria bacterium]|nr:ATP synthase F0 subunit B [Deltaproteobacteria bacterium]
MEQTSSILASGQALIDIDLTVVVQFVIFLTLFVVSNKFLFQPYLKVRALRKSETEGARAEADRMTAQADAKLADYEKQLAVARSKANDEARKVRTEAAAHERDVTDKARSAAMAAITEAQTKVRTETEAARVQLMPQADVIAKAIASKLLGREVA